MDTVQKRRSRLRGWIDLKCEGSQARFVEVTGINQGELSGLLKTKSFGEKKARTLEIQAGMPPMYLDAVDDDSNVSALVNNVSPGPEIRGMLPLISWVKVGEFCDVIDNFEPGDAAAWYPCPVAHGPNAYVLRVAGDSMSPEYRDDLHRSARPVRERRRRDRAYARISGHLQAAADHPGRNVLAGAEPQLA
jgi:hypothetical protein